jgi:hypothetical protein
VVCGHGQLLEQAGSIGFNAIAHPAAGGDFHRKQAVEAAGTGAMAEDGFGGKRRFVRRVSRRNGSDINSRTQACGAVGAGREGHVAKL